jgi:putative flippase GtrA
VSSNRLRGMDPTTQIRFLKFSGVGVIAFLVDVEVFQAAIFLTGMSPYVARVVSFVVATSAAWLLNRTFTFRDAETVRPDLQWVRFFAANLLGGAVNYAIFAVMIATLPLAAAYPVLALAAGSLSGVSFNFTAYHRYVFRTGAEP